MFIDGSAFYLGLPNRPPWISRNTCVYTRQPVQWHATGDVLTRLPAKTHKNRNACLDALSDRHSNQKLRVYTAFNANWLNGVHQGLVTIDRCCSQEYDLTKIKKNPEKWVAGLGLPLV